MMSRFDLHSTWSVSIFREPSLSSVSGLAFEREIDVDVYGRLSRWLVIARRVDFHKACWY